MAGLKVVALISGGKDSLFSVLHCIANGHEVVALANLHPPSHPGQEAADDLDSFMYQTIGHAALPLYETALGLPLYRQAISGVAVNTSKSYGPSSGFSASPDETESLIPLLTRVKAAHPVVNAVCTGAILSDYQRTRVESVALRLGLTPLSYLWQWPNLSPHTQSSLLEDMAAVGQDSRIVKVASGGLDDSFLWQNVADPRTISRLTKAAARFGNASDGAVLGEGGEYETLAVCGPAPLWKGEIVVDENQREVVHGEAGTASIRLLSPGVEPKTLPNSLQTLPVPPVLEPAFQDILDRVSQASGPEPSGADTLVSNQIPADVEAFDQTVAIYIHGTGRLLPGRTAQGANAAEQMRAIMEAESTRLNGLKPYAGFTSIAYTSIILRDMSDFAAVNAVYGSYFTQPNPPARVTLACADVLPNGSDVMLGLTGQDVPEPFASAARKGLHVQSQSYWAPANIGPYSQAVSIPIAVGTELAEDGANDEIVYVAGQIPLVPASMELPSSPSESEFSYQAVLALQHLHRIGNAMNAKTWNAAIAFLAIPSTQHVRAFASQARAVWESFHLHHTDELPEEEEAEDFDIWDVTHGSGHALWHRHTPSTPHQGADARGDVPPLWIINVDALPRGAGIEWVAYGSTSDTAPSTDIRHLHYLLHVFRHRLL